MRFKNQEDILKDLLTSLWMQRILLLKKKGVLLAMQLAFSTNDGQFAITTKTNKELAAKMDISTKVLTRVFRQLEDKGI